MHLTFLGGVGTVTGSKYLLEAGGRRILIDCGLFQGFKQLRLRNWAPLPFDPASLDAVVLTHAHLDHSGYLPLLVRNGFKGPVYATPGTHDLCGVLLPDSGYLQEREAEFANRHGFSKHSPAKPLYTRDDATLCLKQFKAVAFEQDFELGPHLGVRFLPAGHILGAALVRFTVAGITVLFSGDLGRPGSATMVDPTIVQQADYLVVESTYGDRRHEVTDAEDRIADIVNRVADRGGTVLIPAFAVGRTQSLLFHLQQLKADKRIPDLPVFLDSPMAINASEIFCGYLGEHRLTAAQCEATRRVATYVREVEDSKALDASAMPKIIISASGMATGGRILHHLKHFAPDHRNAILFTGFQAGGTRGAAMTGGAETVKIHGGNVPIRAEVETLHMLSAHADADEILAWLGHFRAPPRQTFITHGEPAASDTLRRRIKDELDWPCLVPEYRDRIALI
ncbi:MAG: MBL fold metallo-hydrolase [Proteobacteria bacterium]|nr:MBL fold metallo-hydrolase [Pseudomonadota bacterium]